MSEVQSDEMIFDIGPNTATVLADMIKKQEPLFGMVRLVFEFEQFSQGTEAQGNCRE